jgi:hypothetical protein
MKRMLVPCLISKDLGFGLVYCFFIFLFDKKICKKNRITGFVLLKFERANSSFKRMKYPHHKIGLSNENQPIPVG